MSKNTGSPYSNPTPMEKMPNHTLDIGTVGFRRGPAFFNLRNPRDSVIPGSEHFPCACALVRAILKYRKKKVYSIFSQIIELASLPDVWHYVESYIPLSDPLPQYIFTFLVERKLTRYPIEYLRKRGRKWRKFLLNNPNTIRLRDN